MTKTKIEWCDFSWNPVTGCYHGCDYCYARRIATRFGGNDKLSTFRPWQTDWHRDDNNSERGLLYDEASAEKPMQFVVDKPLVLPFKLDKRKTEKYGRQIFERKKAPYPFDFNPTFHRYRLDEPKRKKTPQTIFVCSMADLFGNWVPDNWIHEVFAACEAAPQHRYVFLTKNPGRYCDLERAGIMPHADNFWFGATFDHSSWNGIGPVNTRPMVNRWHDAGDYYFPMYPEKNRFVCFEPLLCDIGENIGSTGGEWHIIGAETGSRAGKVACQREWVEHIVSWSDEHNVPVFMKDSLIPIVGEENMRRDFPWKEKQNNH